MSYVTDQEFADFLLRRIETPPEGRAGMGKCLLCGHDHAGPSPTNCVEPPSREFFERMTS